MIAVNVTDRQNRRVTFLAEQGQRLLHAGLAQAVGLPHECATGTCGNCKATVVNGEVRPLWEDAPGAKFCRKAGEVLLCQTAAITPLELTLPSAFSPPYSAPCGTMRGRLFSRQMLTADVGLFEVCLDKPLAYKAGQFVLLSGLDVAAPRAYSMTHFEPDEPRLRFLVRRSAEGAFTNQLFNRNIDNDALEVFGPLGRATFDCNERRSFILAAGGSGVAGMLAIIRHALAEKHFRDHPSHLFFGLRDENSSYLLEELSSFVEQSGGGLHIVVAFSEAACSGQHSEKYPLLNFKHGFVHDVMRDALSNDSGWRDQRPLFFLGGPPLMVNATMRMLMTDYKISPTEIRYDRFG